MKTAIILSLLSFLFHIQTNAQNTIEGRVTDKVTRQPLESATVTLQQEGDGNIINYTLTDVDGRFQLSSSSLKDRIITVFYMGYRKKTVPVLAGRPLTIELEQEAIMLKEVQIRSGRVWGRQDTLKYDLTRFASSKDRNVSDVLKKLPGINVEENGTIKYNGKAISNLYVEGMDVSGGRYNQINNNLKADAVQAAEVIEGHQPIKSLRGKTFTDDVALNLKLKPEVRSKWIYTVMAGGGYGEKALYDASFNALQLSRNRQTVYTYKANNTGRNLFSDQQKLASGNSFDRVTDSNLPIFLPLPEPAMPLSQKRLLFNETHTASANRLYRLDEEKQLRFQLGYIHDRTTRQYGSEEIYYFVQDTVHTATNRHDRLKTDCLNAEVNYEDNTVSRYTRENFSFAGTWKSGVSDITGDNAIFEYVDGKLDIHHSKAYQVMTNSPVFDQQLALDDYWKNIGGTTFLPGTNRAADRFVRASFYINAIPKTEDTRTALASVFSVIRNTSVPFGISTPDQPNISSTRWRTVSDQKDKVYYFESTLYPNVFWIDFKDVDFSEKAPVKKLNLLSGKTYAGNTAKEFVATKPFQFLGIK